MKTELKFTVPGEPCAQGRPRFTTAGGYPRAYDPAKSRNYKAFAKYIATHEALKQGWKYNELPLAITVTAYLSIASSKPKKFKEAALKAEELPTKKPDVDNIFKAVTDALSGVLYKDDKQICRAVVNKYYDIEPRLEVELEIIGG